MDVTRRQVMAAGIGFSLAVVPPFLGSRRAIAQVKPPMTVYKDVSCGCCGGWVEHMIRAGYRVTAIDVNDLASVKKRYGIPHQLASCHTAEIAGYVVEGHVPAAAIDRLLSSRPGVARFGGARHADRFAGDGSRWPAARTLRCHRLR